VLEKRKFRIVRDLAPIQENTKLHVDEGMAHRLTDRAKLWSFGLEPSYLFLGKLTALGKDAAIIVDDFIDIPVLQNKNLRQ